MHGGSWLGGGSARGIGPVMEEADLFVQLMRGPSRKSCRDDNGEPPFALIPARRHFTALHPIFIMPFVITLTAVNTGESLYVPDQCERLGPPVINHGRSLL